MGRRGSDGYFDSGLTFSNYLNKKSKDFIGLENLELSGRATCVYMTNLSEACQFLKKIESNGVDLIGALLLVDSESEALMLESEVGGLLSIFRGVVTKAEFVRSEFFYNVFFEEKYVAVFVSQERFCINSFLEGFDVSLYLFDFLSSGFYKSIFIHRLKRFIRERSNYSDVSYGLSLSDMKRVVECDYRPLFFLLSQSVFVIDYGLCHKSKDIGLSDRSFANLINEIESDLVFLGEGRSLKAYSATEGIVKAYSKAGGMGEYYFNIAISNFMSSLQRLGVHTTYGSVSKSILAKPWKKSDRLKSPTIVGRVRDKGFPLEVSDGKITVRTLGSSIVINKHIISCGKRLQPLFKDKQETKELLASFGVRSPVGKIFSTKDNELVFKFIERFFPSKSGVVKPLNGAGGVGITLDVRSIEDVNYALDKVVSKNFIVEEFFKGQDYRLYVVGGVVIAALLRTPACVVGDGRLTLEELIYLKSNERSKKRVFGDEQYSIKIKRGLLERYNEVILKGECINLTETANISQGGESHDVTDVMHPSFQELAASCWFATECVSDHFTIDLLCCDIKESLFDQEYRVIELNARSGHGQVIFPYSGYGRRTVEHMVDYWFPGTYYIPS